MTSHDPRLAIVTHADDAYEAIHAIDHATLAAHAGIPAPVAYQILGSLKTAGGYGLAHALEHLAQSLGRSLGGYDVYEDDGTDPVASVACAMDAILAAAHDAARIGAQLEHAQASIAGQGYHPAR